MTGEKKPVSLPWLHKILRCCWCNKMKVRVILLSNKDICFDIQRKMSFQIFGVMFQLSYIFTYLYPKYFPFPVTSYHWSNCWSNANFLGSEPCWWKGNGTKIHEPPIENKLKGERGNLYIYLHMTLDEARAGYYCFEEIPSEGRNECSDMPETFVDGWHRTGVDRI